jgi:hypothetical protein
MSLEVHRGAARYERKRLEAGATPGSAAAAAVNYREAACALDVFLKRMHVVLNNLGATVCQHRHFMNLAKQIYGLSRRCRGEALALGAVTLGARLVRDGRDVQHTAETVMQSLCCVGYNMCTDRPRMVAAIEARSRELTNLPTGGNMSEEQKTVQAGTSAEPERKARRAMARRARVPGVPPAMLRETVLEQYKRNRAAAELRKALAMHQPIVRMVVIERIARHRSFAQLARQFKLAEENVAEILAKIRPWVKQYTTYYDEDWYWVENARVEVRLPAGSPAGSPA